MKVRDFCEELEVLATRSPEVAELVTCLQRFNDLSLSLVSEKLAKMKVPKVDPVNAANELKTLFQNTHEFERRISEMQRDRDYTKAVFQSVFRALFPNMRPPAASIKKNDLIDRIRRERRRAENLATA